MLDKKILLVSLIILFMTIFAAPIGAQIVPPLENGVSRELARWRAAHVSDVRYKLNLTLEKQSPVLKGSIEISLQTDAAQIVLDWRKVAGKEQFASVSNVSLNNQPAKFAEQNEHLIFSENVKNGANTIKLVFTSPIATSGAAVTRYVDKEDGAEYIYSLFVPSDASTAFPCFDQPDLKARFKLNVVGYGDWEVVSNSPIEYIKNPKCPYSVPVTCQPSISFVETQPISTYVFAFAAGDFAVMSEPPAIAGSQDGERQRPPATAGSQGGERQRPPAIAGGSDIAASIFVRKSQAEKFKQHSQEVFRLNREAVRFLESYFDFKFPFPKYDLVLIPEFPFGGMEHAGATFLRESSIIFPQEPTANDYISRGNVIFHEAAHQWFGDTVTMRWFDDLWLKEGFAEFMAYKTMEKVLPQYNAWKAFYERNKPLAYQTDSTRGTTAIYQEIGNLSAAKSAYGNIVYRKAPSFLRQAEFYLGADKFQTAARAFLKQNAFKNAEWQDLVKSFETATGRNLKVWAENWVKQKSLPKVKVYEELNSIVISSGSREPEKVVDINFRLSSNNDSGNLWEMRTKFLFGDINGKVKEISIDLLANDEPRSYVIKIYKPNSTEQPTFIFPNYQDYGYGIFLLDERSRNYILANINNEKDDFLRAMMWGALWDSVREAELAPGDYVELAIKNVGAEKDELTVATILNRVSTAMNYYIEQSEPPAVAGGLDASPVRPPATAGGSDIAARLEKVLLERMTNAETLGQRVTFYRAFLNLASTDAGKQTLKDVLNGKLQIKDFKLKTKDKFDIVTRLLILNDADAPQFLAQLEKTETGDEAKRYAYAARAAIASAENKQKYFADFLNNKEISESYVEAAIAPFNSIRQRELTQPFLERALAELPNLKRTRKIFFVNAWLAGFIGGQRDEKSLAVVNKFLNDNPNLDRDLRLKVLENLDVIERSVKIRSKF